MKSVLGVNPTVASLRPTARRTIVHDGDIRTFIGGDYHRVLRVVTAVCGDVQRAEDAVQEAIVDVWANNRAVADLAGWVTTAAIHRSRSRWRSLAAEQRAFARLQETAAATREPDQPLDAGLASALAALPRSQRSVIALHYLLDMPIAGIARQLGMAEGTVKVHLHRGRQSLRSALPANPSTEDAFHG